MNRVVPVYTVDDFVMVDVDISQYYKGTTDELLDENTTPNKNIQISLEQPSFVQVIRGFHNPSIALKSTGEIQSNLTDRKYNERDERLASFSSNEIW
jgi:hypothetical protein